MNQDYDNLFLEKIKELILEKIGKVERRMV